MTREHRERTKMPAVDTVEDIEIKAVPSESAEPVEAAPIDGKPTVRMPPIVAGDKLTIEFSDPEKVVAILEAVARILLAKKKVTITVE